MFFCLIGIIIGIKICKYQENYYFVDYLVYGFIGFGIGIILSIILGFILNDFLPKKVIVEETKILALTDNNLIKGEKYLFGSYVDGKYIYRYVVDDKKGKQIKELENSEKVFIKYDNENPRIVKETNVFKYDWLMIFIIKDFEIKTIIYVPDGTITESYEIDLAN